MAASLHGRRDLAAEEDLEGVIERARRRTRATSDAVPVEGVNDWTPALEELLEGLAETASQEAWMYGHMASQAKNWGNRLNIVTGVLTGIIGVEGLVTLLEDDSPPLGIRIVITLLSFLALVALTAHGTWKPETTAAAAIQAGAKLTVLERGIQLQLALSVRRRQKGARYAQTVFEEYETTILDAPTPTTASLAAAETRFGGPAAASPLFRPTRTGRRETLELVEVVSRPEGEHGMRRSRGGTEARRLLPAALEDRRSFLPPLTADQISDAIVGLGRWSPAEPETPEAVFSSDSSG